MAPRKSNFSSKPTYDVVGIVRFFGGPAELARRLKHHQIIDITTNAIAKWQLRESIPAERMADLKALAAILKVRFRPSDFAVRTAKKAA